MRCKSVVLALGLLAGSHGVFADSDSESIRVIIKYKNSSVAAASLKSKIVQLTHLPVKQLTPMANGAYSLILSAPAVSVANKEQTMRSILKKLPGYALDSTID